MGGEDGVSPVLGGILLVAVVTTVGAATFSLVQVFAEDQDVAPRITWLQDDQGDLLLIPRAPEALDWSRFQILADKDIRFALNGDPTTDSDLVSPGTPTDMPPGAISAGDEIRICSDGATGTDLMIWFVDPEMNEQVSGFFKFRIVAQCPAPGP